MFIKVPEPSRAPVSTWTVCFYVSSCSFFWLHPCARFFEASKHIKQVWFLLLFWWPWWISSHYLPPRRVGLLRTLQLPWKLRAKGLRRVHRWCPHCPLQLGRHVSGQLCPPKIQWFTSFISFRFGVHFSFQDKAWQSNITNLEDPGVFYGVVTVDRRCSYSCLVCLAHFGSRRSQSYIHWSSFILSTCRYWWTPSFQCAFNVYAYIYNIILYNDNVSLVAFRAGAHGTSCPPVESEASILIQHPHPAVEQPFGAQKAVVCIHGSREDWWREWRDIFIYIYIHASHDPRRNQLLHWKTLKGRCISAIWHWWVNGICNQLQQSPLFEVYWEFPGTDLQRVQFRGISCHCKLEEVTPVTGQLPTGETTPKKTLEYFGTCARVRQRLVLVEGHFGIFV